MGIWAERIFQHVVLNECDDVQEQFAEIFAAVGSPANMMLLSVETEHSTQLIAELPHAGLLPALSGFERMPADALPNAAELMVGWEDEFEKKFRYQAAAGSM